MSVLRGLLKYLEQGTQLDDLGFAMTDETCQMCGKRQVARREPEYYCRSCTYGALWPETRAALGVNFIPVQPPHPN